MHISEIGTTEAVYCNRNTSVLEAAQLMRNHHVGDVIVVEQPNGERIPVGIVTDRDIVVIVIAEGLDPTSLLVTDIMNTELMTAGDNEDVYETIERMRFKGVRRLPVVNSLGGLVGIVSVDDLLEFLAQEMTELSRISGRQQFLEREIRR